uniref:Uncharacterized protein n=1 Tax=Rangifer tarandus platyrhynchus TaxID=3082113 RepID=A0ACB0ECP5_RANTA|nr:unnamed protein product [Rangifer tarandus platyrhynchus]
MGHAAVERAWSKTRCPRQQCLSGLPKRCACIVTSEHWVRPTFLWPQSGGRSPTPNSESCTVPHASSLHESQTFPGALGSRDPSVFQSSGGRAPPRWRGLGAAAAHAGARRPEAVEGAQGRCGARPAGLGWAGPDRAAVFPLPGAASKQLPRRPPLTLAGSARPAAFPAVRVWVSECSPRPQRERGRRAGAAAGRTAVSGCGEGGSAAGPRGTVWAPCRGVWPAETAVFFFSCSPASLTS